MLGINHSLRGLAFLIRTQRNAQIHACFTAAVVAMAALLQVSAHDWCWLIISIALVWCAEAFNTAIERLADRVTTERDPLIKAAKDLGAAAVLCAALGAAAIGFLILGPPWWEWLRA